MEDWMTHFPFVCWPWPRPRHLLKPSLYRRTFGGFFVVRKDRSLVAYWKTTKNLQQIYGSMMESWRKTWKHHLNFWNSARCNMDLSHKSFDLVVWMKEQKTILEQAMRPGGSLGAPILSVFLSVAWWFGFLGSLWEKLFLRATLIRIANHQIQSTNLPVDSCRLFVPRYADKLAAAAKLWALAQEYGAVQHLSLTSSSEFLLFAFCWVSS